MILSGMTPRDRRLTAAAALLGAAPFLLTAPFCGLYLDDYSFLRMLEGVSPRDLWLAFLRYVPGRNLHIPFFYSLLALTGRSVFAMHLIGVAFDALNAALLFLAVRRVTGLRSVALAAAAAFAVAANHGETHFWINNIPQCQIPVALILASLLLASNGRLFASCAAFVVALFTYDQVFFLWPPLLAVAWSGDRAPRRGRYAAAALGLLVLNAAHLALRYLSPYSAGGRPLIRAADVLSRAWDAAAAVRQGILPWPTSSHAHWAWTFPVIAIALAGAAWLRRAIRFEAKHEAAALDAWTRGVGWRAAAAGGAAWTVLAYGPNLFWYLSPRHSLIPSLGWSVAVAALGARAVSRGGRAARLLPWLGGFFFAVAAVSDVHEGTQWIDSRLLRDDFESAVLRLSPPVDSVFLVGAPRQLRRAPAFNLRHDVAMAAGRAWKRPIEIGDNQLSPTRRGVVYANDLTLLPEADFRWLPAAQANLLAYDPSRRSFSCVAALSVAGPAGPSRELRLRPNAGCTMVLPAAADTLLLSSEARPAPRGVPGASKAGGLALLGASAAIQGGATVLELEWKIETPPAGTLAFIPRLKDSAGRLILDAVFPSRGAKRPYPMIWPLIDDLAAGLSLKPGQGLRQTFALRRVPAGLTSGAVLELDAFKIAPDGRAAPLGTVTAPLSIKR